MRIELSSGTPAEIVEVAGATRGLVVIPDIMGLRPLFDGHVATLAERTGWTTIAVEVFPGREDVGLGDRLGLMGGLDERLLPDVVEAADRTGGDPVGVLGFCMGGMYTYKAAGTGRFCAAASFYGMVHTPETAGGGTGVADPLEEATSAGACPVLAVVGTVDPYTPPDHVAEAESAGITVVRYEDHDHGFVHDPERPVHHPADAADAWDRALAFIESAG